MATYYRWEKHADGWTYNKTQQSNIGLTASGPWSATYYYSTTFPSIDSDGKWILDEQGTFSGGSASRVVSGYIGGLSRGPLMFTGAGGADVTLEFTAGSGSGIYVRQQVDVYTTTEGPGNLVGYVYSTNSNAYTAGEKVGDYWYTNRTTVASPTSPSGLTYPAIISGQNVTLSWSAASSKTSYPVNGYEVSYATNGGSSWTVAGIVTGTTFDFTVPSGATSIIFRVRARDTNNQYGSYTTGTASVVIATPSSISVPQIAMQGYPIAVSWSSVDSAESYTLQRKSSADTDWTQVYSGANLTFTENAGASWTSVQYRVCAVLSGQSGEWATSESIPVAAASNLIVSGTDGDLGTITAPITYNVLTDTGNPITLVELVNGAERTLTLTSGQEVVIPVERLAPGYGGIVLTATVQTASAPVSVTRTWSYYKPPVSAPDGGYRVEQFQNSDGAIVVPQGLAEATFLPSGENMAGPALCRNVVRRLPIAPGYTVEAGDVVDVETSTAPSAGPEIGTLPEGTIVQFNENGVPVDFYLAKQNYEPGLNGQGRVLFVRKDCYDQRQWDAGNVNAYATSDIDTWFNGTYKALLDDDVQAAMGTTTFYYTPGNGNNTVSTLSRAVFALSGTEFGVSHSFLNVEGSALPISSTLRVAHSGGKATNQWTRSPYTLPGYTIYAFYLGGGGDPAPSDCDNPVASSRPCFTLPSTYRSPSYYPTGQKQVVKTLTAGPNVENQITTTTVTDTAICKLDEQYSLMGYIEGYVASMRLINNSDGTAFGGTVTVSTNNASGLTITRLSETTAVVGHIAGNTETLRFLTVNGTTIVPASTTASIAQVGSIGAAVIPLSETSFVVFYNFSGGLKAKVCTVSDTVITQGAEYPLTSNTGANYISATLLPAGSSGNQRVCVCYADTGDGNKGKAVVATVDSAGAVTWGTAVTFEDGTAQFIYCCELDGSVIVVYKLSTPIYGIALSISGSAITAGPKAQIAATGAYNAVSNISNSVAVVYAVGNTSGSAVIVTNDNGTLKVGSAFQFNSDSSYYLSSAQISHNKIVIAYRDGGNSGRTTVLESQGDQIAGSFTDSSTTAIALESGTDGDEIPIIYSGIVEASFADPENDITSGGVWGFAPVDGVLQVVPKQIASKISALQTNALNQIGG